MKIPLLHERKTSNLLGVNNLFLIAAIVAEGKDKPSGQKARAVFFNRCFQTSAVALFSFKY